MSFDAERFLTAQAAVYSQVQAELQSGRKTSHWMWFIFPQLAGLGHSQTARFYALDNLAAARDYLYHPELGERLRACCRLLTKHTHVSAQHIFGCPDDLKLRSCLTLFMAVEPAEPIFEQLLLQFYRGEPDQRTLALLCGDFRSLTN